MYLFACIAASVRCTALIFALASGMALVYEGAPIVVEDAQLAVVVSGVDGRMARTAVVVFIVAVCWQRRRAFAVMAWIARLIRFCGLLGLQISFSAECALKLEISFCPRRPGTSGGPPFQNANPEAAPVTGSELPGLTTVPLAGPPLQFARADVPEPSPEPPGKPLPTALGPWQGAAPPRRKAPPPLPPYEPYCGLCGFRPAGRLQCAFCDKHLCHTPTCLVIRCEACYDARLQYDVNWEIRDHLRSMGRAGAEEKQTQSCTTYTSVRGAAQPRFQILAQANEGVWDQDGNLCVTLAGINVCL